MNPLKRFNRIEKLFAWSFFGVVVTLAIAWFTRDANLKVECISNVPVYDLHVKMPELSILFNGENIKDKGEVLSLVTLRFENTGAKPIIQNMYDQTAPFGVIFSEGRIFAPNVFDWTQDYLKKNVSPRLGQDREILLNKVVIDASAHFDIRVLVLHSDQSEPVMSVEGKIAGMDIEQIKAAKPGIADSRKSWLPSWQLAILGLLLGILSSLASEFVSKVITKVKKRRLDGNGTALSAAFKAFRGSLDSSFATPLSNILVQHKSFGFTFLNYITENGLSPNIFQFLTALIGDSADKSSIGTLVTPLIEVSAFVEGDDRLEFSPTFKENFAAFKQFLDSEAGEKWRHYTS